MFMVPVGIEASLCVQKRGRDPVMCPGGEKRGLGQSVIVLRPLGRAIEQINLRARIHRPRLTEEVKEPQTEKTA